MNNFTKKDLTIIASGISRLEPMPIELYRKINGMIKDYSDNEKRGNKLDDINSLATVNSILI